MNNVQIQIEQQNFKIIDVVEKITIADSFVVPSNKTGGGNGEAKLYVGQNNYNTLDFFGKRGFEVNCILSKHNLLQYLNNVYSEYKDPSQIYRDNDKLSELWDLRFDMINNLDSIIKFRIKDQNQIEGPRVYINSVNESLDKKNYNTLREIPLPNISYFNIYKIENDSFEKLYYFTLNLIGIENPIYESKNYNLEINKFIPTSEDVDYVEKEISNELSDIETPFDPNKIKVRTTPSHIGQIINDLEDNFINLNTEFQRLPNLWNDTKKSRFIESLLLRLPIPAFYFNEKEENELEVIDGLQRISTIKNYVIHENFKLINLEFLTEYNGLFFHELPSTFQRRIKTFQITTYVIEKGTPNTVKYNIFKRVNTGGLELREQEIRHAINQGVPSELVADLARGEDTIDETNKICTRKNHDGEEIKLYATREGKEFIKATDNKIDPYRMEDRDFITRFVSFYLINYTNYEPNLDTFLNNGMAAIKELSKVDISRLKDDFYNSMKLAYEIFGNDAFRKRFSKSDGRKPINKALFEVLSVSFSKLSESERNKLWQNKERFKVKFIELHHNLAFLRSITQGTAMRDSVIRRFQEVEKIIKETIGNDY
ncbi:DUF262 domain-containing protein [Flavobacterium johnsoniae]|uniref:GmrSD restriction endonucleases N-terminal domain-containing protein n=1 Tax=Flavobacterium johnsoniae TaxID=986 RepID=A0A1M5TJU3_FLAJO|nr:DUF262 domain-containing protein [Flavobacterium johnsoniae]SHH51042.1 Protein of unknown function DUF262 [Flavobacterium johnsoniae]